MNDEETIRGLQQRWMQAWVERDVQTIEEILAPDFALTVSAMPDRTVRRHEWIGALSHYSATGFRYEKMQVRLFGEKVAVVSSLGTPEGAAVDGADRSFTFFLTDVWRKRDGRWQVAARYSSLPEGGTASAAALVEAAEDVSAKAGG